MTTLRADGVEIRRGERSVIHGLSFGAARGEVVALMGVSGTGKTTVLRAIGGLDPIAAGTIDIDGLRLSATSLRGTVARELHRRVGLVFQFHHLFGHLNAADNVSLALVHVLRQPRADAERRARELLSMLGVGDRGAALPHQLSGGEAQRVAIARALAVDPQVLLMDEPTASLDRARRIELGLTLRQLAEQGRTVVVATHDAEFARAADRVLVLENGRVVREGSPADLLA